MKVVTRNRGRTTIAERCTSLAQIALLEGEAVEPAGINVKDGQVLLNMDRKVIVLHGTQAATGLPQLSLKASDQCAESKVAHCRKMGALSNNIWHLEFKGSHP